MGPVIRRAALLTLASARQFVATLVSVLAFAAMTSGKAVAQDDELPNGPGKDVLIDVCTQCHAIGMVVAQNREPEEWDEIIARMVGMGAPANPDQQKAILAYLSKNFSKTPPPAAAAAATPAESPDARRRAQGQEIWTRPRGLANRESNMKPRLAKFAAAVSSLQVRQ